ncbi:MAG: methylmalonyl Co-A mutase-associated GTPase MeaB [Stappiaceae bacterium]
MTSALQTIRSGGKSALARALSSVESGFGSVDVAALLDEAVADPQGHVLGITGPPGVGKSTLTNVLIDFWRRRGETVGVIAIDPSSQVTGGALLGDRTRLATDPEDTGVFVRSMAARERIGGLSDHAIAGTALMRAAMDHVIVETVGIGQSEADVALVSDTILLCIQPGSGDSLQFMKAGVMELPDMIAVTKADMGAFAVRARADVEGALSLVYREKNEWSVPVSLISASNSDSIGELMERFSAHRSFLAEEERLGRRRSAQHTSWIGDYVKRRYGTEGVKKFNAIKPNGMSAATPFASMIDADQLLGFEGIRR